VRPYFVLEGNICALLATKDDVNVFLYDGAIVPDPEGIITGGQRQSDRAHRRDRWRHHRHDGPDAVCRRLGSVAGAELWSSRG
jgi:hypothetical protein